MFKTCKLITFVPYDMSVYVKEPTTTEITPEINASIVRIKDTQVNCFPIDPHKYTELIFNKGRKTIQWKYKVF